MAERVEQVTETTTNPGVRQTEVSSTEVRREKVTGGRLLARVIRFITAIIVSLLALRFLLLLLGANRGTGFVDFVVNITEPLVVPFRGIFSNPADTVRFEPHTLTAIVIYALIGAALAYLANIRQTRTS